MAVMTTQHAEPGLLDEKPTKMDATHGVNGNGGVNGHNSPGATQLESKSEGDLQNASDDGVKQTKNQDAFTANQTVQVQSTAENQEREPSPHLEEVTEVKDAGETTDKEAAAVESMPEPVKKSTPEPKSEPLQQPTPEKSAPEVDNDGTASVVPPEKTSEPEKPAAAPDSVSDLSPVPDIKEDVAMPDADAPAAVPITETVESTQETVMTDAPPATPTDETSIQAVSSSTIVKDASQVSPVQPPTADTSMSDAPPPATKISRSRSPDDEDGPLAKRTKLDNTADQVEVKPNVEVKADATNVDKPSTTGSLYLESGEPKPLNDPSLDPLPLTDYQARQIRAVLALVKKTKAGANFKLPVIEMWPALGTDYVAKIETPIDISTMEKKLRGDLPRYKTMGDFKADVERLVKNSILFNGEAHEVTRYARQTREGIYTRMAQNNAAEPVKAEKKDSVKQHPTRHTEPRVTAQHPPAPPKPPKPAAAAPTKPVESPAFAIPAANNGVPLIRRDSTKGNDGRAKRPVKPAHSKDLVYDTKRKKKLSPELRFCEEVLTELRKSKYYDLNAAFMQPVDPVALNIPSYHKIIKKPMDLSTMDRKIKAGEYLNLKDFDKDFEQIIKNCRTFNGEDHIITQAALRLHDLYKAEMAKKDSWMAKHAPPTAPPSQAATSPRPGDDDSDHDDAASGDEDQPDGAERKAIQDRIKAAQERLDEENRKIEDIMLSGESNFSAIELSQQVVNMLQKNILADRAKLANMGPKKAAKPSKSSKPKKSGGATGGSSGGTKKSSSGNTAGSSTKKAPAKKPKRKMGALEKEVIAAGIADLEGHQLERAIDIIKMDTNTGENDSGELELDIEQLSHEALVKLYDIAIKSFPNLRAEKEKTFAAPSYADTPSAKPKPAGTKSKKNKPMSRVEQERRIQQLNDLRAQASRHGSGSQEPMESIEGNGRASVDPAPQPAAHDSEDEESSEEE